MELAGLTPWPPLHQRWRGGQGVTARSALRLLQQITLDTYRGQQLCLCLRSERQPPQFDETQRSIVVELITTIIRCQAVAIERMLRFSPNNSAMPRGQLYAHHAADKTLRALNICRQV